MRWRVRTLAMLHITNDSSASMDVGPRYGRFLRVYVEICRRHQHARTSCVSQGRVTMAAQALGGRVRGSPSDGPLLTGSV